ncbi:unnamed protein product, partial [Urochloa humidicola]
QPRCGLLSPHSHTRRRSSRQLPAWRSAARRLAVPALLSLPHALRGRINRPPNLDGVCRSAAMAGLAADLSPGGGHGGIGGRSESWRRPQQRHGRHRSTLTVASRRQQGVQARTLEVSVEKVCYTGGEDGPAALDGPVEGAANM